eukprot:762969-Hanusia_phi.AAC.6
MTGRSWERRRGRGCGREGGGREEEEELTGLDLHFTLLMLLLCLLRHAVSLPRPVIPQPSDLLNQPHAGLHALSVLPGMRQQLVVLPRFRHPPQLLAEPPVRLVPLQSLLQARGSIDRRLQFLRLLHRPSTQDRSGHVSHLIGVDLALPRVSVRVLPRRVLPSSVQLALASRPIPLSPRMPPRLARVPPFRFRLIHAELLVHDVGRASRLRRLGLGRFRSHARPSGALAELIVVGMAVRVQLKLVQPPLPPAVHEDG